ncbi:MAG: class I SAM-dependent methyltransferase [Anaerolineae bacterium]
MAQTKVGDGPDTPAMTRSDDAVARAFSRKALIYDAFGQDHPNLTRMRQQVYRHLLGYVQPPARILELNAGTGADAAFLARLGFSVHATDIAPGMIAQITNKIERDGLEGRLSVEQRSFTDLDAIQAEPFDCIFSNLGGLNCIQDLQRVSRQVPRLLRKGGIVTWVIMPPRCLWDFAAVLQGDWRLATRRLARNGVWANIEGVRVMTFYHSPEKVMQAFDNQFQVERVQGLSIFAPPADRKQFALRFPRFYQFLVRLDEKVADRHPFRGWGDFFVLTLRYAQTTYGK